MKSHTITQTSLNRLRKQIQFGRSQLLDIFECSLGNDPRWERVKSKILAVFGFKGLARFMRDPSEWDKFDFEDEIFFEPFNGLPLTRPESESKNLQQERTQQC